MQASETAAAKRLEACPAWPAGQADAIRVVPPELKNSPPVRLAARGVSCFRRAMLRRRLAGIALGARMEAETAINIEGGYSLGVRLPKATG
ncbi:MAG: hypothetical protein OXC26_16590 [Albidovulum sp.]|nr:hypothetical protein [Albidovulum sp.]